MENFFILHTPLFYRPRVYAKIGELEKSHSSSPIQSRTLYGSTGMDSLAQIYRGYLS
jgi:hypothetical protein